jgi:hypothetical protein
MASEEVIGGSSKVETTYVDPQADDDADEELPF